MTGDKMGQNDANEASKIRNAANDIELLKKLQSHNHETRKVILDNLRRFAAEHDKCHT